VLYVFVIAAWEESPILAEGLQSLDYSTEVEAEICKTHRRAAEISAKMRSERAGQRKRSLNRKKMDVHNA